MNQKKRFALFVILIIFIMAIPMTVLASKQMFKARMNTGAELHDVIDSNASGAAVFGIRPGDMVFMLSARNLTSTPTGVQLHAPANESETAAAILTLCGEPAPAAVADCTMVNGNLSVRGEVTSGLLAQWGITSQQLTQYLNDGQVYVNVYTDLNPEGEIRGQIYSR